MSKKLNDLINSTNIIIVENLKKLFENFTVINKFQEDNDENEFDIFFCKINIYFRNIIEQIKLKYIKALESYEKIIEQNNKDILELIMENMLLKIDKNSIESHQKINKEKIKNNKDYLIHSLLKVEFNNNNNYCNINTKTNFYNTGIQKKSYGSQENYNKNSKKKIVTNKNIHPINNNKINNLNELFLMNKIEGIDSNNSINQDTICHESNIKSIFTEPNYDNNEKSDNYYFIKKIKKEMNEILNKNNETKNNIPICYNKKSTNETNKWNKKKKKLNTPKNLKKNFYKGLSEINFSSETPKELLINNNDNNNFTNYNKIININNTNNNKRCKKVANTSFLNIHNKYNITKKILLHSKGKKRESKHNNNSSNIVNNSMNNNESNISFNNKLRTKTRNNFNSINYLFNNNKNNYTTTIATSDVLQDNNIKNNFMTNNSNNGFNSYINQSQIDNLNKKSQINNKIIHNYQNQKKYFDFNNKANKYKYNGK